MSSPSTPQNPPKPHQPNNIIHLKSWHSSYAPLATIKVWINSIEGQLRSCGNKLPPPTCTALSQSNKPHRINLLPATPTRDVILAKPQESSFWRSPRSRHSGEARISVLAFVAPLHFQEDRISRTESTFYPQLAANESFAGVTSAKASFSPLTLMS